MINHARTLLVNLSGSGFVFDCPGEELISEDYRELQLPAYLNTIRARLFGASPDRLMLNYRTAQLLQLIAGTELQTHILALDPRLTYTSPRGLLSDAVFQPQIRQFYGSGQLYLLGEPISPDAGGRTYYNYQIEVAGGTVTVQRLAFPATQSSELLSMTNGLSQEISLPYSGYRFRLDTDIPAGWVLRGFLRPQATLSEIFRSLQRIGESQLLQLFGTADVEPYLTFRNCWNKHAEFAYRFGGLLLALIYRTEECRNG